MAAAAGAPWPRIRLVGGAAVAGAVAGILVVVALGLWAADLRFAIRKSFALGAVLMGFGLLGWSGSILVGDGYEAMQRHLDVNTGWTERTSRRAMARIGGFGAGLMLAASVVTVLAPT